MKHFVTSILVMVFVYGITYLFFSFWNWNFHIDEWSGYTRGLGLLTAFFWTQVSIKTFAKI
tara:strand:- start:362 stop:544 length:183 start_codon:yes stop_codon:yes gene_type:complete